MTDSILETMAAVIRSSSSFAPLIALAAGVITSFTPCSLTNVSLIVSYIGNSGEHTTKRSLLYSAVFALGNTITFVILGIIAVSTGTLMGRYSRILYIILGALMILMAFQTWGIFTVIPSTDLLVKNKKRGCAGALVSGVLGGIFSSPCSTPVLIALLATVAAQKSFAWGILLMALYGIGHCALSIAAGTSIGFVKQITAGRSFTTIGIVLRICTGIVIMILGIYLFMLAF